MVMSIFPQKPAVSLPTLVAVAPGGAVGVAVQAPTPIENVLAGSEPWFVMTTVEKLEAPGALLVRAPNLLAVQPVLAFVAMAAPVPVDRHVVVVPPVGVTCSCIRRLPDCALSPMLVTEAVNPPRLA